MRADLLIENVGQLLTLAGPAGPRRGPAMQDLGIVEDGVVAVKQGRIVAVGKRGGFEGSITPDNVLDAKGRVVMPGFVDPHTHAVWAGDRRDEFEMRARGATYMDIMRAGGGIMNTVRKTRLASADDLVRESWPRFSYMLAYGTTTAEVKSGYGLDMENELKMLDAIALLNVEQPVELVPTFLGAHAIPEEFADNPDGYVDLVVDEMLPEVADLVYRIGEESRPDDPMPASYVKAAEFCDVFCEEGAFDLQQSRRILARAKELGMKLKIHSDEFRSLGGTALAVELGATSADHLVVTPPEEIALLAASDTIAVALPGTPFGLGKPEYAPARAIIDAGGALAIATDLNPGTSWCESMQMMIALSVRYMRMTPAEAVTAATINAAWAIDRGDQIGSLEIGKQADILILDTDDYRDLAYRYGTNMVAQVIKAGEVMFEE